MANFEKRMTDENGDDDLKSVIDAGTIIKGEISGDAPLYLDGELEGTVRLDSLLFLREKGRLKGDIEAKNIVVEGKIEGEVVVKNKIEIRTTGHFTGSLTCKQIAVAEGAFFQGEVKMAGGKNVDPAYFKEKRKELQEK